MNLKRPTLTAAALLAALTIAPVAAQSSRPSDAPGQSRQGQQDRASQARSSARTGEWEPQAFSIVGYDLNRDGRTDAWYQVTTYEYDRMRQDQQRSGGRPTSGQVMGRPYDDRQRYDARFHQGSARSAPYQGDRRWEPTMNQRGTRQPYAAPARSTAQRITGTLEDVTTFTFSNDDRKHVVGKLRLQDGRTLPVHFGHENSLSADVRDGERITVLGETGRLNDHRIIIAREVLDKSGRHAVHRASDGNMHRCSGEIIAVVPVTLRDGSQSLLADVRSDDGRVKTVALGARDGLGKAGISIKEGATVKILGHSAMVAGQDVLLADRVCMEGKTARVSPSRQRLMNADDFSQVFSRLDNRGSDQ